MKGFISEKDFDEYSRGVVKHMIVWAEDCDPEGWVESRGHVPRGLPSLPVTILEVEVESP